MSNLLYKTRKAVLTIMTISFLALVTELTLELHLLSHEHTDNHNSSQCPICQQLLTTQNKFAIEIQAFNQDIKLIEEYIESSLQTPVISFRHEPFGPRPPPNYSA
jgi:hypothetical protein